MNGKVYELIKKMTSIKKRKYSPAYENRFGNSLLHFAAAENDMDLICDLIIRVEPNINVKNLYGNTPLHIAIQNQHATLASFLIKSGADINIQNNDGNTSLHLAFDCLYHMTESMIKSGGNIYIENKFKETPLHRIRAINHDEHIYYHKLMRKLLNDNINVNLPDRDGNTLLHNTIMCDNVFIFDQLYVYKDTQFNLQNDEGKTALHIAANCGNNHMIEMLLSKCNYYLKNNRGETALDLYLIPNIYNTIFQDIGIVLLFFNKGFDPFVLKENKLMGPTMTKVVDHYKKLYLKPPLSKLLERYGVIQQYDNIINYLF